MSSPKLYTSVDTPDLKAQLSLGLPILCMGSCFAEHLGKRLQDYKFTTTVNPGGILFNPISIAKVLKWSMGQEDWGKELMAENEGVWTHFHLHSQVYGRSRGELDEKMQELRALFSQIIPSTQVLMLTLGTAWVYEHLDTGEIVANCHKMPNKHFVKKCLSISAVAEAISSIQALMPHTQILLTVSPVRHLRDTLALNSVSKATLRLACHELSQRAGIEYFPAYEILLDELRDYRFYKSDLLHPNEQAVDYIWERFVQAGISTEGQAWVKHWQGIMRDLAHRPRVIGTPSHQKFIQQLILKLERVAEVDVSEELAWVRGES